MIYIEDDFVGIDEALDHPRLCFHKWGATVTATNSADGANPEWMDDGDTWSVWTAGSSSVTVTLTFSGLRVIDYVGIAAHDLDESGSTFTLQVSSGSGFSDVDGVASISPDDGSTILALMSATSATMVRIVITGSSAPSIGVFQAGRTMELPRKATYTALPISESEQVTFRYAQSVKGQVLGTAVEAAELGFTIDVDNLSEAFRKGTGITSWGEFISHVREGSPFFVASRPVGSVTYHDDVAYGVAREIPRFNRAVANHAISGSVSLNFLGYKRP